MISFLLLPLVLWKIRTTYCLEKRTTRLSAILLGLKWGIITYLAATAFMLLAVMDSSHARDFFEADSQLTWLKLGIMGVMNVAVTAALALVVTSDFRSACGVELCK